MECGLCKYAALAFSDYPCRECKNTAVTDSEEYNARPDMFEPATNPEPETENDVINHPSHYTQGGIECIDAMKSAFGAAQLAVYCKMQRLSTSGAVSIKTVQRTLKRLSGISTNYWN